MRNRDTSGSHCRENNGASTSTTSTTTCLIVKDLIIYITSGNKRAETWSSKNIHKALVGTWKIIHRFVLEIEIKLVHITERIMAHLPPPHKYTYTHIHIYTHIYTYIHINIHTHTNIYTYTYTHTEKE